MPFRPCSKPYTSLLVPSPTSFAFANASMPSTTGLMDQHLDDYEDVEEILSDDEGDVLAYDSPVTRRTEDGDVGLSTKPRLSINTQVTVQIEPLLYSGRTIYSPDAGTSNSSCFKYRKNSREDALKSPRLQEEPQFSYNDEAPHTGPGEWPYRTRAAQGCFFSAEPEQSSPRRRSRTPEFCWSSSSSSSSEGYSSPSDESCSEYFWSSPISENRFTDEVYTPTLSWTSPLCSDDCKGSSDRDDEGVGDAMFDEYIHIDQCME